MGIRGRALPAVTCTPIFLLLLLLPPSPVSAGQQGSNGGGWSDLNILGDSVALCKDGAFDGTDPLAECKRQVDGERAGHLVFKGGISMRTAAGDPEETRLKL